MQVPIMKSSIPTKLICWIFQQQKQREKKKIKLNFHVSCFHLGVEKKLQKKRCLVRINAQIL